jgi:hypothetical protein
VQSGVTFHSTAVSKSNLQNWRYRGCHKGHLFYAIVEFAAFLRAKSGRYDVVEPSMVQEQVAEITFETAVERQQPIRVVSPHLVNREQIADFRLEVIEEANDRLQ